jgi:hypothetical protein
MRAVAAAMFGLALCGAGWSQTAAIQSASYAPSVDSRAIGEITLVVGPAVRTSAGGVPEAIQRGTRILPGDRIDTAEGGMAHIRFIDGALVSLRPGSRLTVEDYRYDPKQVAQSLVKFRLDRGVARAISGAAAEGAKERFRLNTPLVAIGVRGTDFVVRTGAEATTAAVNQGAIVMAPFSAGCLAQALGPCTSPGARLLSADMGQLVVEFKPTLAQPEFRSMRNVAPPPSAESVDVASAGPGAGAANPQRPAQPAEEAMGAQLVKDVARAAESVTPPVTPPVTSVPDTPVVVVPPPPPQLMWGRWGASSVAAGDLSVPDAQAAQGREVTVANNQYGLFRIQSSANASLPAGLGAYDFALAGGQAQFDPTGKATQAATVQSGQLRIDFGARNFTTNITVNSAATGSVGIAGAGFVRDDGVFIDRRVEGQAIAGAAAMDGKTAGYFFEKAVANGTLSGITLWSRP